MLEPLYKKALITFAICFSANIYALDVPGPLVSTQWLEQHLQAVVLLDVRNKPETFSSAGHIPGARLMDWEAVNVKRTIEGVALEKMMPDAQAFSHLMRSLGVNEDSAVVVTTDGKNSAEVTFGTRVYWGLKYYQHENVAVLDGGTAQWLKEGKATTKEVPEIKPGNFSIKGENNSILATTAEVKQALDTGSAQLLDARTLDFYLGIAQKPYVSAKGHIPNAKHFPHPMLVSGDSPATFLAAIELEKAMQAMGLNTDKSIIVYCNSGHLASGPWFILSALLHKSDIRIYEGSMHEWTKGNSLPLVTMKME